MGVRRPRRRKVPGARRRQAIFRFVARVRLSAVEPKNSPEPKWATLPSGDRRRRDPATLVRHLVAERQRGELVTAGIRDTDQLVRLEGVVHVDETGHSGPGRRRRRDRQRDRGIAPGSTYAGAKPNVSPLYAVHRSPVDGVTVGSNAWVIVSKVALAVAEGGPWTGTARSHWG